MRRQRGVTLIEILIAMLLASIVSMFVLMITRTQLIAYEQTDQVTRMQQNERSGVGYVENLLRRACGGIAYGRVGVNVGAIQKTVDCLTVYDGATKSGGSFVNGTASTTADAVEVIYGTTPFSSVIATPDLLSATPSAQLANISGFLKGDLVLIADKNFQQAVLLQISQDPIAGATSPQGTLKLGNLGAAVCPGVGCPATLVAAPDMVVMKAVSRALYLETAATVTAGSANAVYKDMLMLDSDGVAGSAHDTTTNDAQPLVENVVDFQVAIGRDDNADGTVTENAASKGTDEWYGNASGELPLAVGMWNDIAADPQPRWLRLSFVFQTSHDYPGSSAAGIQAFEDRTTYPSPVPAPRYRPVRITVAPRVWNLSN